MRLPTLFGRLCPLPDGATDARLPEHRALNDKLLSEAPTSTRRRCRNAKSAEPDLYRTRADRAVSATPTPRSEQTELRTALHRDATPKKTAERTDCVALRITPQFSGRALPHVPWHFIHDGPLQLLVMRRDTHA